MKLSLAMIARDEEAVLSRCLESVRDVVDEIIIADTGSADKTKEIARRFTDKVYDFVWCDDFSAARNFAFGKASGDFIMWLDADDIIDEENAEKLRKLKAGKCDFDIVYMKYNASANFSYYRERIARRSVNPVWVEPVHEVMVASGRTIYTDITVEHRKLKENPAGRNLKIMEGALAEGRKLSPRLTYYYGRELMYNNRTADAVKAFEAFLSMPGGWAENKIGACLDLADCYLATGGDALPVLFRSFTFGVPRSEILCKIGEIFLSSGQLDSAEYWYRAALKCKISKSNMGFIQTDYYGFIPAIQLAVIYSRLGRPRTANKYNEIAGKFHPDHPSYLHNKNYFAAYIKL
jgi:glycosyltransferase involved in cell wall biosynthesis